MLIFEFMLLLLFLYAGSRFGGIGLGVVSGIGLLFEVFVLRMPPTAPPINVMLIILAVVTCASILEAAGGLKYMLQIAERILRSNPKRITILGPIVTYLMTLMLGTGHAVYSVMPIIGDIALKNDIRPERPMAAASVASQLGITGSPISAAVIYYLGEIIRLPGFENVTLLNIVAVTIPATFCGVIALSLYSLRRGKELKDDPEYQRRLQDPTWRERIMNTTSTTLDEKLPSSARNAVLLFILALISIVVVAMVPSIRTLNAEQGPWASSDAAVVPAVAAGKTSVSLPAYALEEGALRVTGEGASVAEKNGIFTINVPERVKPGETVQVSLIKKGETEPTDVVLTRGADKPVSMTLIIQMMMLGFGGVILLATRTNVQKVPNGVVFKSGMVATIAIFGIAWMSDTYFSYAMPQFKGAVMEMVSQYPWAFAFALFAVSVVINSQAATGRMLLPVGIGLGLPAPLLIGLMPATYGYFFIPNYPSDIATINFDVSGTTKIGKYYFNHSFMAPGLVGVVTACIIGVMLSNVFIG
ncbi:anaerobic C4-dicarboxylate transporter [Cardiobacteriaceae bacterium TAE3-ERU3]|nr:anaerobic C4-dicarboxylate transporter [Cardiobacteriaceae bacterium TAE3-ERU3]